MKILLVGSGGYGITYVRELLKQEKKDIIWEGIVDPFFDGCLEKESVLQLKIPVYDTMQEFYSKHSADLAIISTPPYLHCEQSIYALKNGSCVLCEKPVAPTVGEAEKMQRAEKEYGRFIAVGYQWSFAKAIIDLKKDVLSGVLGKPLSFKTVVCFPRNFAYFKRGVGWAGKISKDGHTILDSIASNACAHYFHNMLFILGNDLNKSAKVDALEATCYRANDIETFDTCSVKAYANDTKLYFIASHATPKHHDPQFCFEFENATVTYSKVQGGTVKAVFKNGSIKDYGDPFESGAEKLWRAIEALKEDKAPVCTVESAVPQTAFIEMLHAKTEYKQCPPALLEPNPKGDGVCIKGLYEKILDSYDKEELLYLN